MRKATKAKKEGGGKKKRQTKKPFLTKEPFQKKDGTLFALLLTLYPISRFTIEVIRDDEPGAYCGLTISQVVSVALLLLAVGLWIYLRRLGGAKVRPPAQ